MAFRLINGRFLTGFALAGFMLAAAGCQSGDAGGVLGLGGSKEKAAGGRQGPGERAAGLLPEGDAEGRHRLLQQLRQGRRGRSGQALLPGLDLRGDAQLQPRKRHADHERRGRRPRRAGSGWRVRNGRRCRSGSWSLQGEEVLYSQLHQPSGRGRRQPGTAVHLQRSQRHRPDPRADKTLQVLPASTPARRRRSRKSSQ